MPQVELEEVIEEAARAEVSKVSVALPATVLSYDPETQTATVQLAISSFLIDPDEDRWVPQIEDPVGSCPVAFPSGGGSSVTWPLEAGDTCLVVFCDRSIDEWMATNNSTNVPFHRRRFDISDAVVVPGLRSAANPLADTAYGDGLFLTHKDTQVRAGDGTFAVQNSTTELLADLVAVLNQIKTGIISTPSGPGAFDAATQTALGTIIDRIATLEE